MKFDFVIGNPPYQESRDTTKDMPVYDRFMDAAYEVSDKVELITPGRFLFNAGATSKKWNEKMLQSKHFKVLEFQKDSSTVFPNTEIKGGIAIHYYDRHREYEKINVFTEYDDLNRIKNKVIESSDFENIGKIMYPYSTYTLADGFWNDYPELKKEVEYIAKHRNTLKKEEKEGKLSNLRIITSNIFDLLDFVFKDSCDNKSDYVCVMGRQNMKRCYKWIDKRYINLGDNYKKWKVIVSAVNGSGKFGEQLASPFVEKPEIAYTQTFLGIGACDCKEDAEAILKYIKSKFARALLGVLKSTQHNPPEKWKYVPLQDFTSNSDIDWSKSVAEIDQQLYKKYGLSQKEIDFIETHVKEMV